MSGLSSPSVNPGSCSGTGKMRIAYFTNRYPAVSHTFIRREIRALEDLGVSVHRFALRPGADLVDEEDKSEAKQTRFVLKAGLGELFRCCVTVLLGRPLAVISAIRQALLMGWHSESGVARHLAYVAEAAVLADWCRRDGIQHIHAHFGTNPAAVALLTKQLCGIPYSFTAHGPDEFEKAPLLSLDKKLAHAEFAVCVSSFGRSQFMRWSPPNLWQKIAVVHCGLDRAFFERPVDPPPPSPRLVCVGRLDERKAQILLVAAASQLVEEGTRCEIVLAGDGEMRPNIEEAIRRAGLQESFTITGWVSGERVKAELDAARAMVLPSFSENLPVAIMEAMALCRPVISTYVAGIPELIEPGKTGWLVPAGDEVALAGAMREALIAPAAQLAAMGAAGRRHILDQHDALKEAEKLKCLLERSTGKKM
jgi:colanic acid/amylovoran biosynthesis glycosyltransferase